MLFPSLVTAGSLITTFLLTAALQRYSFSRGLVDFPNSRSSHEAPTPRGGGLSVVVPVLVALGVMVLHGTILTKTGLALGAGGLIVATVGFMVDHTHVPVLPRLLSHFLAASWGLYWLGGLPEVVLWKEPIDLGLAGHIAGCVFLVWMLNLYNFMDGINGIAGIELITVAIGGLVVSNLAGVHDANMLLAVLIATGLGFLVWNFPQARIFMGDACSGFLGLLIGLIAVWQGLIKADLFMAWVILLGTFIVDATLTLIRRILQGHPFYEPHRTHAYQVASRHYGSHVPVSLGVGFINLVWLTPMAMLSVISTLPAMVVLGLAWTPLVLLALHFRAGQQERRVL